MLFSNANITHLVALKSDHCPLLLQTNPTVLRLPRPFRFESMWTLNHEAAEIIQAAWPQPLNILAKLKMTKLALKEWNKISFGHLQTKIKTLKDMIKEVQAGPQSSDHIHSKLMLSRELDALLLQEEMLWRDKAKARWTEDGDANTHYFHLTTIVHRNHNSIQRILTDRSIWISTREQIGQAFVQYSHFCSPQSHLISQYFCRS